jgi:large subunit ribosomal protein L21
MVKIAVIKTGGKQYKVAVGQALNIEKLDKKQGDKVKFETFLVAEENDLRLGRPSLGEQVEGEIIEQGRHDKISVVKFKNKTRYTRNRGHRQPFTKVKITSIA